MEPVLAPQAEDILGTVLVQLPVPAYDNNFLFN
jgi:hypothetical protein